MPFWSQEGLKLFNKARNELKFQRTLLPLPAPAHVDRFVKSRQGLDLRIPGLKQLVDMKVAEHWYVVPVAPGGVRAVLVGGHKDTYVYDGKGLLEIFPFLDKNHNPKQGRVIPIGAVLDGIYYPQRSKGEFHVLDAWALPGDSTAYIFKSRPKARDRQSLVSIFVASLRANHHRVRYSFPIPLRKFNPNNINNHPSGRDEKISEVYIIRCEGIRGQIPHSELFLYICTSTSLVMYFHSKHIHISLK